MTKNEPGGAAAIPTTHAGAVLTYADAMLRAALWPGLAVAVVGIVVSTVVTGVPGLVGGAIGAGLALGGSLFTLYMMRRSAELQPMMLMGVALGSFFAKLIALFIIATLLKGVSWLNARSLAFTMLATFAVWTYFEVRGFRSAKVPTLIMPPSDADPDA
ncbi:hypothetical protein F0L68_21035 [Solihabitans fulvus]|uniref:ATP synthase protein I n=1 Tax=Solihabitans fulvus TaxID=1892852 RepID=A0A5B2X7P7_9PSEU|nr:hypothetical protein [Solihabitans fulvus]KAA2259427.1 hypothetical protein F0L68_21035 [Solihabitans fulvus]